MADVLKIALERRNKLHDEIKKLEDFIRMAETLVRGDGPVQMPENVPMPLTDPMPAPTQTAVQKPATVASDGGEDEESPMRAAARKLSDAEVRRAPESDAGMGSDAPRPSIIRRGFGS